MALTVTNITNTSATVKLSEESRLGTRTYARKLYINLKGVSGTQVEYDLAANVNYSNSTWSVPMTGLSPGTSYTASWTTYRTGPWQLEDQDTTEFTTTAPASLNVCSYGGATGSVSVTTTSNSITVKVSNIRATAAATTGDIDYCLVKIYCDNEQETSSLVLYWDGSYTISNLNPDTPYDIKVLIGATDIYDETIWTDEEEGYGSGSIEISSYSVSSSNIRKIDGVWYADLLVSFTLTNTVEVGLYTRYDVTLNSNLWSSSLNKNNSPCVNGADYSTVGGEYIASRSSKSYNLTFVKAYLGQQDNTTVSFNFKITPYHYVYPDNYLCGNTMATNISASGSRNIELIKQFWWNTETDRPDTKKIIKDYITAAKWNSLCNELGLTSIANKSPDDAIVGTEVREIILKLGGSATNYPASDFQKGQPCLATWFMAIEDLYNG